MAESVTNRGKYRALNALFGGGAAITDARMAVILGTQTGIHSVDLNTMADLDAVTSVSFHTERIALTGEAVTEDDTDDRAEFDTANVTFAAAPGVTAQGVAVYEFNASDSSADLIAVYSTGFPQPMDGGLTVNVTDLIRIT